MKFRYSYFLSGLVGLMLAGNASAQTYSDDAQIRAEISLRKSIGKRLVINLDEKNRFTKNVSEFTRAAVALGATYKFNKYVRLYAEYQFINKKKDKDLGYFEQKDWFSLALTLRKDFGYWRLAYRNKFQARRGAFDSYNHDLVKLYDRHKVSLSYEINKRLEGSVAGEVYIPLNNPQNPGIERVRGYLGMDINTFKHQQLQLTFIYQYYFWQSGKWWDTGDKYATGYTNRDFIYRIRYVIAF